MRDDDYGRYGLMAASVAMAGLCYLATCSTARASDYEALWRNPDTTRTVHWVRLCDTASCSRAVAVDCGPGATCRTRFTDPPAGRELWVASSEDGAVWSLPSNSLASDVCLLSTACRVDIDRSGTITVADFAEFLRVMGTTWR